MIFYDRVNELEILGLFEEGSTLSNKAHLQTCAKRGHFLPITILLSLVVAAVIVIKW